MTEKTFYTYQPIEVWLVMRTHSQAPIRYLTPYDAEDEWNLESAGLRFNGVVLLQKIPMSMHRQAESMGLILRVLPYFAD